MRLACIYALLDHSLAIRKAHLEAALALWRYCEASARWIFGDDVGDPFVDEIRRLLGGSPEGLSRTEISKSFQGHRAQGAIDAALVQLRTNGLADSEKEKTTGRPTEIWRLTSKGEI